MKPTSTKPKDNTSQSEPRPDSALKQEEEQSALQTRSDQVSRESDPLITGTPEVQTIETVNTIRSRFLTTAAHEFRTPLSAILSSAELAEKYLALGNTARLEAHLSKIKLAALQITGILNDFLSILRLEEGRISLQPMTFDAGAFCSDMVEEMRGLTKSGQEIILHAPTTHCLVMLDMKLLREIVFNMILNAIKYSDKNVEVTCQLKESMLEIQVRDQGIGIPQVEQKYIFERFFRANNVTNIPGTGIGLNLTKKYLELMNGSIGFESAEGKGSTFFVKIPMSPA
jgi:signal transduction histidine kinase